MGDKQVIRSNCRGCHGGCGVLVTVVDGRITKVEGDPEAPTNRGTLCPMGIAYPQLVYHPDRLTYPVKRAGERGEGKWQRISWDEALDTIVNKYKQIIAESGPEAIAIAQGSAKDFTEFLSRFAHLLGTPNLASAGHVCYAPKLGATLVTCGNLPVCDYNAQPKCVVVWGNNLVWTHADEYKAENLTRTLATGAKLIVIDPRLTYLAGRADIWLQVRPGTDVALGLGMANVIVNEGLYDKEFVQKYTHGWDKFVERVNEYPPEKVEEITWVPADKIRAAARMYAETKPGCVQWGVALEQSINAVDNNRIIADLMAITGNLDVPGGNAFFNPPPVRTLSHFGMYRELPETQLQKRLGGNVYKLASKVAIVTPKLIWEAILTGKPYRLRALQVHGSNPLVTRANAREVYAALRKVEFLAVADFFMTPTAELADIVLPVSTWLELEHLAGYHLRHGFVFPRRQIVQIGECWPDHKIFNELTKKLCPDAKQFETVEDGLDYILEPSGMKWEQVRDMPYLKGEMTYRKYEKKGFATPTKKVELYSTIFEEWGYDPLPRYRELPESPVSQPALAKEYPYILTTGARSTVYYHSEYRSLPWLNEVHPEPLVEIHPDTAAKHNIKDGDWVFIENQRGRVKQRAKLTTGIDPRVISAQHGWWFPDKKTPDHGWDESNINILTDNGPFGLDPAMGSTNLRALLCRIYPVNGEKLD